MATPRLRCAAWPCTMMRAQAEKLRRLSWCSFCAKEFTRVSAVAVFSFNHRHRRRFCHGMLQAQDA